jgi:hypothetical protein
MKHTLGIITEEPQGNSVDTRFFVVLLSSGKQQLINENYLLPGEKQPVDDLG